LKILQEENEKLKSILGSSKPENKFSISTDYESEEKPNSNSTSFY